MHTIIHRLHLCQIRVESILSNGVVGKEPLEVHLNKPGHPFKYIHTCLQTYTRACAHTYIHTHISPHIHILISLLTHYHHRSTFAHPFTYTGQNNSKLRDVPKLEKFHKIEKRKRKFGDKYGTNAQMSTKDDSRSGKTPGGERRGTVTSHRQSRKASIMGGHNNGSVRDLNERDSSGTPHQGTCCHCLCELFLQITNTVSKHTPPSLPYPRDYLWHTL